MDTLLVGTRPLVIGVVSSRETLDRPVSMELSGADVVEIRVDLVGADAPWLSYSRELRSRGLSVLLTIRDASEGGLWAGTGKDREALYAQALPEVAAIDIELRHPSFPAVVAQARAAGRKVIGSFHDFIRTPPIDMLEQILKKGGDADIVKVAALTQTPADVEVLKALLARRGGRPVCALGMGPLGLSSRIELARAGSCLVYGYADVPNAPGQPSCAELAEALKAAGLR